MAGASLVWVALHQPPNGPRRNAPDASRTASGDLVVCVGPDSVLRSPLSGVCPPGTERLSLSGPDVKKLDSADANGPSGPNASRESDLDRRLAQLVQRVDDLEDSDLFEVVDSKDRVLFSVAPDKVRLYDQGRVAVATIIGTADGGEFSVRTNSGVSASIAGLSTHAGLRVQEADAVRIDLTKQEMGNYSLKFPLGDGMVAGVGESPAGTGALVISDSAARHRASLEVDVGRGTIAVFNGGGSGVGVLSESASGGGVLALTDASSFAVVKMGVNYNRYGVVMTFPPGFPYIPRSGLPGSYMLGCAANAGGQVCVP